MHFIFEKIDDENGLQNFIKCDDLNTSGIPRFPISPLVNALTLNKTLFKDRSIDPTFSCTPLYDRPYVISTGVAHDPSFWAEGPKDNKKTLFEYLNKDYIQDLQKGKAFLLLDQSHEGCHESWLWEWMHTNANKYDVPIQQIIYITGDFNAPKNYKAWYSQFDLKVKMHVIVYEIFETHISSILTKHNNRKRITNIDKQFAYKEKHLKSIKDYNCLQKRARGHRVFLFDKLSENKLLDKGINSMNKLPNESIHYFKDFPIFCEEKRVRELNKLLPIIPKYYQNKENLFTSPHNGELIQELNFEIMCHSWLTVVSEAHYFTAAETGFLSEKTFKPIACGHPFIIYGAKFSLQRIKELGYKTFEPFIDESYDNLDDISRIDKIIMILKDFCQKSQKEKLQFYQNCMPILQFNQNLILRKFRMNSTIYNQIRIIVENDYDY